jgi:hypothetical protein
MHKYDYISKEPEDMTTDISQRISKPTTAEPINDLFRQALIEDSNLEMDWLWLATRVSSLQQRRFALERALQINPRSELARRGLIQLSRRPDQPIDLQ